MSCSQAQERRIRALERELDASIVAAARSREEKRAAEIGQRAAEARAKEVLEELENTTSKDVNIYDFSPLCCFNFRRNLLCSFAPIFCLSLCSSVFSSGIHCSPSLSFSPPCRLIQSNNDCLQIFYPQRRRGFVVVQDPPFLLSCFEANL